MDEQRADLLLEIGELRQQTNEIFMGHDGVAIAALCGEYLAKWVMAHDKHERQTAINAHIDLLVHLIGIYGEIVGDPDPLGKDEGHANLKH